MDAPFPEICPDDVSVESAGQRAAAAAVGFGGGVPWVASLEATAVHECRWTSLNTCFESVTCDCAQHGALQFDPVDLRLRSVEDLPRTFTVAIEADPNSMLAVAERSSHELVIAVASRERSDSGSVQTRLRVFDLDAL